MASMMLLLLLQPQQSSLIDCSTLPAKLRQSLLLTQGFIGSHNQLITEWHGRFILLTHIYGVLAICPDRRFAETETGKYVYLSSDYITVGIRRGVSN